MTIKVKNLSVSFKTANKKHINVIDNLSFSINPGEIFSLLGESGCGKSLTASAIMQLLPNNAYCHPTSHIFFKETDLLSLSEREMRYYRGKKIAIIFQEPMTSLNPVLTILEQLSEVIKNKKYSKGEIRAESISLLNTVDIKNPEKRIDDYPHQFSGGQKQRIMIAMAIASKPELLIADEPTTALDVTVQAQILKLLQKITQEMGMAMLLISHDLSIVKQVSHHIGVMYAGQLVECSPAKLFFDNPKHPYSKRLLNCIPSLGKRGYQLSPILGCIPNLELINKGCRFSERCEFSNKDCLKPLVLTGENSHKVACINYHMGKKLLLSNDNIPRDPAFSGEKTEVLSVSKLKIHYPIYKGLFKREIDTVKAVDEVSFSLFKGETLALVGESGSGKTTLSRGICQLLPITSGEVSIGGKLIQGYSRALTSQLQIIFQDPFSSMNPRMLVNDILQEGIYAQKKAHSTTESDLAVKNLLELVGLPQRSAQCYPHEFSGGQRQRISIARALAVKPSIIICDEPTSALDVSIQAQILNLLLDLQSELGLSYLFISHDLSVVSYMSDQIMIMKEGKIVERGKTNEIIRRPKHSYTKTLMKAVGHTPHSNLC